MHAPPRSQPFPSIAQFRGRVAGFSLVEVAMAIAIIAVAFVALFALLPVGLNSFRSSVDTANETWIMQGLNSMIQTTEWEQVWNQSSRTSELSKDVYYFDEEGRLIETKLKPAFDTQQAALARVYSVKLVIDEAYRNGVIGKELFTTSTDGGGGGGSQKAIAVRVVAVIANVSNPKAVSAFDTVNSLADITNLEKDAPVSIRSFMATQMNAAR